MALYFDSFSKDQDEFATTKAMIEGTVKDIVKSNIIMILAKPQNTTIDFNDFPISGEINITPDCKNEKFITLIYDVIKNFAGPDRNQSLF